MSQLSIFELPAFEEHNKVEDVSCDKPGCVKQQESVKEIMRVSLQHKIYSPKEFRETGQDWTYKQAKQWEDEIWKVQRRERAERRFTSWWDCIDIYVRERDSI